MPQKPDSLTRARIMNYLRELILRLEDTNGNFSITKLNAELEIGSTVARAIRELGYMEKEGGNRWRTWKWVYGRTYITMQMVDAILQQAQTFNSRRYMLERRQLRLDSQCINGRICQG